MNRYILLSFGFLGLAFYELSGGADFQPRDGFANSGSIQIAQIEEEDPSVNTVARLSLVDDAGLSGGEDIEQTDTDAALQAAVLAAIKTDEIEAEDIPEQDIRINVTLPVDQPAERTDEIQQAETPEPEAQRLDLRAVARDRVNLREGPGTDFSVLGRLSRGTTVQVLEETGDGWVMLQVVPEGQTGWMADWLLTKDG